MSVRGEIETRPEPAQVEDRRDERSGTFGMMHLAACCGGAAAAVLAVVVIGWLT
jgi:hypothetical protein